MKRVKLSPEDAARIGAAVAEAERGTTGEIRCVLADDRDYARSALAAVCVALAAPALALALGVFPPQGFAVFAGWIAAHGMAGEAVALSTLNSYVAAQAIVLVLALAFALSPAPRWLTPSGWRDAAVDRAAKAQFTALGLTHTAGRTGVLLYVSLAHHRAEVLADEGIYAHAPHASWDEVIALLTAGLADGRAADGFVAAVGRIGAILSEHLPASAGEPNELPDLPVVVR